MAMSNAQFLLGKLAEEAAEVAQIALKAQQFGLDEVKPGQSYTNAERIQQELNDLIAVVGMLEGEGFTFEQQEDQLYSKVDRVIQYREYSVKLGMVER